MKESKIKQWYNKNSKNTVGKDMKQNQDTLIEELFDELPIRSQRDMLDSLYLRYKANKAIPVGQQQLNIINERCF